MYDQYYEAALIRKKRRNLSINRSSANISIHALLSLLFFNHGFIQIRFGLLDFFSFFCYCFMGNKNCSSKLVLLNFCCQKISFPCGKFFYWWKTYTMKFRYKVTAFHESISFFMKCSSNCISWNALKEKVHSVSLP